MKKPTTAKGSSYVERKLPKGGKIRIPYKIKKTTGRDAKFEVTGEIKVSDVDLRNTELKGSIQTKADDGGTVWVMMGPIWLRANKYGTNVVDPIQRDVKKVLAELKQQVAAGESLR